MLCYYPERTKLTEVTPSRVAALVAWLCDEKAQGRRVDDQHREAKAAKLGVPLSSLPRDKDARLALSDATIRNVLAPLRACLASAMREGLLRSNPSRDVDLPHRPTAEESEEERVRAMGAEELSTLLGLIPDRHRLMFRLLAASGLRISEAIALQWRHLEQPAFTLARYVHLLDGDMGAPLELGAARGVSASVSTRPVSGFADGGQDNRKTPQ